MPVSPKAEALNRTASIVAPVMDGPLIVPPFSVPVTVMLPDIVPLVALISPVITAFVACIEPSYLTRKGHEYGLLAPVLTPNAAFPGTGADGADMTTLAGVSTLSIVSVVSL